MTPSEVADLLSLSVELDRYATADKMTRERVVAWAAVLAAHAPSMTFAEAQALVIDYYGLHGESLTPQRLVELWRDKKRLLPSQVAADVRTARAMGLVAAAWPTSTPVPDHVAAKLADVRSRRQAEAVELEAGAPVLALGAGDGSHSGQ